MTCFDQSHLYCQNSAVFQNIVLYSPDPPSVCTDGLGMSLACPRGFSLSALASAVPWSSLVPRLSKPPVFDRFQYVQFAY